LLGSFAKSKGKCISALIRLRESQKGHSVGEESPVVQHLFDQIKDCVSKAVAFDDVIYRSCGVKYANEKDFLSGDGAAYGGGRWNPPGIRAVYGSLDVMTATKESYQNLIDAGFKDKNIKPRVIAGATVKVERLLNLTDANIRRKLGFRLDELLDEDWKGIQLGGEESWTQAIGRGCREAGFEGLIVPSARNRPKGKNLVIFPDELAKGSSCKVIAKEELPPHPSQW
jgi:RES domain-containing protein